jgi:hypothetical protein
METRPGILTTEFWTTVLTGLYFVLNATGALDNIPNTVSGVGLAIISALYALSRGWAKSTSPSDGNRGMFALGPRRNQP